MTDTEFKIRGLELALREIEAYKESILSEGHTERLVASAKAITDYIKNDVIPNR